MLASKKDTLIAEGKKLCFGPPFLVCMIHFLVALNIASFAKRFIAHADLQPEQDRCSLGVVGFTNHHSVMLVATRFGVCKASGKKARR